MMTDNPGSSSLKTIERVLFVGSKRLGLTCLSTLYRLAPQRLIGVVTMDDTSDTRSVLPEFEAFCAQAGLACHVARHREESEGFIRTLQPDLCIVVGWYWFITETTLDLVPHGFIGLHNSLLPRYRGGSPLVWALINGETSVGISLFSFTPGMDDGDIWAQASTPVSDADTIGDVLARLEQQAVALFESHYPDILSGRLKPVPQNHQEATFCAMRKPEDGFINWMQPAQAVYNFIRAQTHPYPGAFTLYRQERLTIWKARLENQTVYYGTPGQVARVTPDGVYVICGDHHPVVLETVGYQEKTLPAQEVLRSVQIRFPVVPGFTVP